MDVKQVRFSCQGVTLIDIKTFKNMTTVFKHASKSKNNYTLVTGLTSYYISNGWQEN